MDLPTRARALIGLLRDNNQDGAALERAEADAQAALSASTNVDAIEQTLELDSNDELPIAFKTAAFERLLALGAHRPELLRAFADHLWLHGPAHDERVQALRLEADQLTHAKPTKP